MPINSFLYPAPSTPSFAYDVANSVRLNAGDNPSGTVTQGTPTNVDKYTFSVWVKRVDLGAGNSKIFSVTSGSTYGEEKLEFNNDDLIWRQTEPSEGNTNWERVTDRKFRDPSAWLHIVVAYDSSQGTAGDRCKMYINGVQETSFSGSSNPSSGQDSYTNTSGRALKFFALYQNTNSQNAGAYFAEMVYIDGQQLDPTSFGEFDSDSPNIWKPIDVSGLTFGNNGFYLDFEDSSALGNDVSGNNNDVTFSNIASTDQSTDTCTNNFATLNPLFRSRFENDGVLSEGNLKLVTGPTDGDKCLFLTTQGVTQGKWYWEIKDVGGGRAMIGVGYDSISSFNNFFGSNNPSNGFAFYATNGNLYYDNTNTSYGSATSANDIIMVALDMDNHRCWFGKNGTWFDSATQSEIENSTSTNDATTQMGTQQNLNSGEPVFPLVADTTGNGDIELLANFGSPPFSISSGNSDANGYGNFEYAVPSGYYSLNTKNLAEFG